MRKHLIGLALALPGSWMLGWGLLRHHTAADEPRPPAEATAEKAGAASKTWTTAVEPKPLSDRVRKGLDWLVKHQLEGGAWGQGEESPTMRGGGQDPLRDRPNVADTCIAALALIRSGSTPAQGTYKEPIARAVRFVAAQVEDSDSQSIAVTTVQGTRVQQKLGPNIDTFLASMLLAEAKGRMPSEAEGRRVDAALAKVLDKIRRHQKDDGSFDGQGWAPILAQALCGKGINRARQAGADVPVPVLARAEEGAKRSFDLAVRPVGSPVAASATGPVAGRAGSFGLGMAGGFGSPRGDAGVELYSRAASLGVLQDSVNTNAALETQLKRDAETAAEPRVRTLAKQELGRIADAKRYQQDAQAAVVARLSDPQFVSGFGSNGGEEFLSYMNIAESLVVKGGPEWTKWDDEMTGNLNRVQNDDGSWTGHHCITGRTFCTSAALLVLMADRTPVPAETKGGRGADVR